MSRDDAQSGRDAASAPQTSRRRSDHRQRRNGRSDGQRADETRRPGLGHFSSVESTARHPQRGTDGGRLSRNQMELARDVKGQDKIVTATTTGGYWKMNASRSVLHEVLDNFLNR